MVSPMLTYVKEVEQHEPMEQGIQEIKTRTWVIITFERGTNERFLIVIMFYVVVCL